MRTEPFITVVMPCYNGDKYLEKVLEAFFSQDYPNKQLVIIDGKSTDRSHGIIADFISRGYPLVWDKTPDAGISNAINIGLNYLSESHIFGYLGSDDVLLPNTLNEVAYMFRMAPKLDGVYFDSYSYLCESNVMSYRKCPTSEFSLKNLVEIGTIVGLQNIYIQGSHVLAHRFSEKNKYSMDYDLYVRLATKGLSKFTYIPRASTINFMDGNVSSEYAIEGALEAIRVAVAHVGYIPALLPKIYRLNRAKIKLWIIAGLRNLLRLKR